MESDKKSFWKRVVLNPKVGIVGSVASIIAVPLAIYFYMASIREREVLYHVYPQRTWIVNSDATSLLTVKHNGQDVDSDISTAIISIWNAGGESVKPDNVLKQLTVRTENDAPILEAKLLRVSREVVEMRLDTEHMLDGCIGVDWKILEEGDGCTLQLIIAAGVDCQLIVDGTIEGQGDIEFSHRNYRLAQIFTWLLGVAIPLVPIVLIALVVRLRSFNYRTGLRTATVLVFYLLFLTTIFKWLDSTIEWIYFLGGPPSSITL